MGWLRRHPEPESKDQWVLTFICDSPGNSWGTPCSKTSSETIAGESLESCLISAKQRGWKLDSNEEPFIVGGVEVGGALCPNCSQYLDWHD